ncbi:CTP-dependent riboflavin kinase [Methanobacterium alcaliphilum]|nr:CTP-dependent riboflavin kinase [Methanobacterium alcaliphilum]MCK9152344.1 CTP-dependent riboflavin kinase [Methanobacterium alcaliphilum]
MKINGLITSGSGKGEYFMSQDIYTSQFKDKLGFIPFKGTLNILIEKEDLDKIHSIKNKNSEVIKGSKGFGNVLLVEANLQDNVKGAIIFPAKTTHPEEFLEFVAAEGLRKSLHLRDGDSVTLNIKE